MTADELPTRFCRFCKTLTKQIIAEKNDHNRVCIVCWRRQRDGDRVEIADGERLSQPARRDSRPPSFPPPPSLGEDLVTRTDFNDALRRIAKLEEQMIGVDHSLATKQSNIRY